MSCGGGKHGNYGLVSYAAAVVSAECGDKYPVSRVAELYHSVIPDSIKADEDNGKVFQRPTGEQVLTFLNGRLDALDGDDRIPADRKNTIRNNLNKRISMIEEEMAQGGAVRGDGGSSIPTAQQWEAWKRLLVYARADFQQNNCPNCGRWPGRNHSCNGSSGSSSPTPEVAPQQGPPPLRDLMDIPTPGGDPIHTPTPIGTAAKVAPETPQVPPIMLSPQRVAEIQANPNFYADAERLGDAAVDRVTGTFNRCDECGQFTSPQRSHRCTGTYGMEAYDRDPAGFMQNSGDLARGVYDEALADPSIRALITTEDEQHLYAARLGTGAMLGTALAYGAFDGDEHRAVQRYVDATDQTYYEARAAGATPEQASRKALSDNYDTLGRHLEETSARLAASPGPATPPDAPGTTAAQAAAMADIDARRAHAEAEASFEEMQAKYGRLPNCPGCGQFYVPADGHTCASGATETPIHIAPQRAAAAPQNEPNAPHVAVGEGFEDTYAYATAAMANPSAWVADRQAAGADMIDRAFGSQQLVDRYPSAHARGAAATVYGVRAALSEIPVPEEHAEETHRLMKEGAEAAYEAYTADGHPPFVAARLAVNEMVAESKIGLLNMVDRGGEFSGDVFDDGAPKPRPGKTRKGGLVTGRDYVPLDPDLAAGYAGATFTATDPNAPVSVAGGRARCRACGQFMSATDSHTCPGRRVVDNDGNRLTPANPLDPNQPGGGATPNEKEEPPPLGYVRCAACRNFTALNSDGTPPKQCAACKNNPTDKPLPADTKIDGGQAADPGDEAQQEKVRSGRITALKVMGIAAAALFLPYPILIPLAIVWALNLRKKKRQERNVKERTKRGKGAASKMGQMSAPEKTVSEQAAEDQAAPVVVDEAQRRENIRQVVEEADAANAAAGANDATRVLGDDTPTARVTRPIPVTPKRHSIATRVMAFLSGSSPSDYKPVGSLAQQIRDIRQNRANARLVQKVRERNIRLRRLPLSEPAPAAKPSGPPSATSIPDLSGLSYPGSTPSAQRPDYEYAGR